MWDIPMGEQRTGVYYATPPELLHLYGLGIEKKCFEYMWTLIILVHAKGKAKVPMKNRQVDELDRWISIFTTRH